MTSLKGFLKKSFAAALVAAPFMAAVNDAAAAPPPQSQGRPLTTGEYALTALFGKELTANAMQIHAGPNKGDTIAETFDTRMIAFYGHPFLSLDYSKETDAVNYGSFIHETTHIWQFQTGLTYTNGQCPGGYIYRLKDNSRLEDFCHESQAAIVEDYARRYIMPKSAPTKWYKHACGDDTIEHDAQLLKVVETRFPGAREMREKLGRGEVLPDAHHAAKDAPACPSVADETPPPVAQKGQPVYFCETLAYAFANIKGIAFKEGLAAWPGYDAKLGKKAPVCTVAIWDTAIMNISGKDFGENGQIKANALGLLAQQLVKYAPQGMIEPMHNSLSDLFGNLVEKQQAEIKALKNIQSKEAAQRILNNLETQLQDDPSLPPNSRGFVEEKIRIVKGVMQKLDQPVDAAPLKKRPDAKIAPVGHGGNGGKVMPDAPQPPEKKIAQRLPEKKPEAAPLDPDKNIKDVLDSAFGRKTPAPKAPAA